uniref:Uncharacterized protein n=1 Tax=Meloidogyne javanica TaxID=6303 RepID=A0A915LH18_MELJA
MPSFPSSFVGGVVGGVVGSSPLDELIKAAAVAQAAASTSWSGEMAALLCRGEGEGINSAAGFRGSWGNDGSGYLGNALGGNQNKLEFVKLKFANCKT